MDEEPDCERCGASMIIPPELEPTPLCNLCAQDLATRLWDLRDSLDAATRAAVGLSCDTAPMEDKGRFQEAVVVVRLGKELNTELIRKALRDSTPPPPDLPETKDPPGV